MNKDTPIIVEQAFDSAIDKIWGAITAPDQMRQWFFEAIDSFAPVPGFETAFTVQSNDKAYLHLWKVTEVVPGKQIVYNWRYGGYPGDSYVSWKLTSNNDHSTTLVLTHEGQSSFPQDNPDFSRQSCVEGWNYFIRQRLKSFLEGEK
jgi:uncharacterized protein YndB with AHSA1/START domain